MFIKTFGNLPVLSNICALKMVCVGTFLVLFEQTSGWYAVNDRLLLEITPEGSSVAHLRLPPSDLLIHSVFLQTVCLHG